MLLKRSRVRISTFLSFLALSPLTHSSQAFCVGSSSLVNSAVPCRGGATNCENQALSRTRPGDRKQQIIGNNFQWPCLRGGSNDDQDTTLEESELRPRGGGSKKAGMNDQKIEMTEEEKHAEKWRQRGMSIALSSTYLSVMGAKCALPSVLSLLISSKTGLTFSSDGLSPQGLMARLLGLSTLVIASGKLLLGPVIDALGGIRSLQLALASLAVLLATISCTQTFSVFAASWVFVDFIFSSCWAGCLNAIHQSFPEKDWGKQVGILAAGARAGNAVAFALFASILFSLEDKMKQPWRVIFGVSALLQAVPLALLTYFGGKTLEHEDLNRDVEVPKKSTIASSIKTLGREAATPEFWLHMLSRSSLMVFASFLLFVPTLMSQVYGASNAFAAQVGSIYALGCLLSVTLGSSKFSKLKRGKQALAGFSLLAAATFSSVAQLAHVSGIWTISAKAGAALMFLWGFAFSVPFYIPPSLYALSRGGKESSATIADAFDIAGFMLLAVFNGYVASIRHATPAAWIPTFQITTACSVASMISLTLAILRQ